MIGRHLLDTGDVLYFSLDEISPRAGGGWHAVVASPTAVVGVETFPDEATAALWLSEQIPSHHTCGIGCWAGDADR